LQHAQLKTLTSMIQLFTNTGFRRISILSGCALLVAACAGGYQAPVSDQGERQIVKAPIIVDSSASGSSFRIDESKAVIVSSASSNTSAIASRESGQHVAESTVLNPRTYRVRSGDTLFSIAFQHDLDFRKLAIANGLNPPYTIFVGQEINLELNAIPRGSSVVASTNIGAVVDNNSVARTRAGGGSSAVVLRQPVASASRNVQWQWPHQGRLLKAFQPGVNKGLDIGGKIGDPVFAAGAGDVVYSGRGVQGTGDLIIIRHSDRYLSAYAHNSAMLVSEGAHVRAGDRIAKIGENPAGVPMLHFEIREDGNSVDPSRFLPSR